MMLKELANKIRIHILHMTNKGKSSHIGSAFSIVDILTVLYSKILNVDPKEPLSKNRDRFILSKGHAGAAIYATLAEHDFFSPDLLVNHYQDGSIFSGHVSHKGVPGVDFSTGSLGHGLAVAAGRALAAKKRNEDYFVYTILGDGECDEGSVWEAALFASHFKINNLIAIIDYNKIQSLDFVENTIRLEPLRSKWESFGWKVFNVDGHDLKALEETLIKSKLQEQPVVIIADTVKGKGVSFMENTVLWHYRIPQGEEFTKALAELKAKV